MCKNIFLVALISLISIVPVYAQSEEKVSANHHMMMSDNTNDNRVSLNLPPHMKEHQLENMRSHVEAVQTIIGLIAENDFSKASEVAHTKLGLTEEMNRMCSMFENEDFRTIGFQFHESADDLAETLKTKDMKKSLWALNKTMGYCVQCHAGFRQ